MSRFVCIASLLIIITMAAAIASTAISLASLENETLTNAPDHATPTTANP